MKKIIKPGDRSIASIRFSCEVCGCIFEANRAEYTIKCIDELGNKIYTCKCPCYGRKVFEREHR